MVDAAWNHDECILIVALGDGDGRLVVGSVRVGQSEHAASGDGFNLFLGFTEFIILLLGAQRGQRAVGDGVTLKADQVLHLHDLIPV